MDEVNAQWLRRMLDTTNIKQKEIAELLEIRPEQVTRILQSKRRIQDQERALLIERFADVLQPSSESLPIPARAFFARPENGGVTMIFQTGEPENQTVTIFVKRDFFETFKGFISEL